MKSLWTDFASARGIQAQNVQHRKSGSGLGLFTTSATQGTVLTIPSSEVFNKQNVSRILHISKEYSEKQLLVFWFLCLKYRKVEGYEEYVALLPQTVDYAVVWPPDSVEYLLLEGTGLEVPVEAKRKSLKSDFDTLKELWKLAGPVTFEDYVWAEHMVSSRSMESPVDTSLFVCPVLDFCNHASTPNAYWHPTETGIELRLLDRVEKDSEIFISYGEKSNAELLFLHGFCIPGNPIQVVQFLPPYFELQDHSQIGQDVDPEVCAVVEASGSVKDKKALAKQLGFDSVISLRPPRAIDGDDSFGIIGHGSLCTMFLCMLTPEQGLLKKDGVYQLNNTSIEKGNFFRLCKENKFYDVLLLQIWTILTDMVSIRIETLSQELEDDIKGLNDNVTLVENFRKEQLEILLQIHPVLETLQSGLIQSPVVQDFLSRNQ